MNATVSSVNGISFPCKMEQLMEEGMVMDSTMTIQEDAALIQSYLWKMMVETKNSNTRT